ncbi:hypothetical protein TWF506_004378 [Arthrobotrys conoides]|uniref:BTB domain-containing protein n=1 Tax=Arthrobotrys conoides TaxID=74498 RepID=A0AAN8NFP1_9PEZI
MGQTQSCQNFTHIFNQSDFSDVLITVGANTNNPKDYHLHQAIIRTSSKTLDSQCESAPTEDGRKKIVINQWDHATMETLFRWVYGERDLKKLRLTLPALETLMKATREFQIKDLNRDILDNAVELATSKIPKGYFSSFDSEDYWNTVENVCGLVNGDDITELLLLRGLIDKLPISKISLEWERFRRLASVSNLGVLSALISGTFGDTISKTLCKGCQEIPVEKLNESGFTCCSRCKKTIQG